MRTTQSHGIDLKPNHSDELLDVWTSSTEFIGLKMYYTQGFMAELEEFSLVDNPYKQSSPEYCYWLAGFMAAVHKRTKGTVQV